MRGPIDYIVVAFKGNNFSGQILEELDQASRDGVIAVLDLAIIIRDKDGNVAAAEITDPEIADLANDLSIEKGMIDDDDVEEIGALLENNSAAGLLIVEQLWAKPLKRAIIDANGTLIGDGRIHPEASKELDNEGEA
jgi:uncharacterized membrane protein